MAVNLLEKDRLVYHDLAGDTIEVDLLVNPDGLAVRAIELDTSYRIVVDFDRDAVETLRDALTCWLETGKLK